MKSGTGFIVLRMAVAAVLSASWVGPVLSAWAEDRSYSDVNLEFLEKRQRAQNWGRDPFALPEAASSAREDVGDQDLHLSAIIYRKGRGVAIINNQILRKGDAVGGKVVDEILQDRVVLRDASGRHELRVNRFAMGR